MQTLGGTIKRVTRFVWRLASVISASVACGAGIGLFEGEIFARNWEGHSQITFAEGSALFGGTVALILGPLLYYAVLREHLSFEEFAGITAFAGILGCLTAIFSDLLAPIATVIASIVAVVVILARRRLSHSDQPLMR